MSKTPIINVTCHVGGLDISSDTNDLAVTDKAAVEVVTNFASGGWQEIIGGIASADWKYKGFWEAVAVTSEPDQTFFNSLGTLVPVAYSMTRPQAQGDVAYFMQCQGMTYAPHEIVGKARSFDLDMMGNGVQARGQVLDAETDTATGVGEGITLPAVGATQTLYAQIQVLSLTGTGGPTFAPVIQSDTLINFPAPTARITFPVFSAYGASHLSVPGPITDTKYRLSFAVTGVGPSVTYAVYIGIR
jgi:hypothetical protein